ncbi:ABC transporter substrate-binding protein [Halobacillus andaensis]|uniref:ABC transporter substrate-binding protein n=1 Tax=Halobacillus andaensis TaxID=1176239 RepID=A0A917B7S8_HALAA|nr:ABC transporter substrate-binding protein [Halobacillus andaensis]MBP2005656.1 raffinose/stachyose/melibiose transport system substrate-binding protein [Halobacillus andaensis]GGF27025.1 ABC transporter substrate-binding protein [Halobacillus andaensis]
MKKEIVTICLIGALSLSLSACQKKTETETEETTMDDKEITLNVRNPKVEIASPFEQMVQAYEKEHPNINIEVHTVGGAMDDFSDLKAQMAAGNGPDIFTNPGYESARVWSEYLEDLSDQPWVDDAYEETLTPMTFDDSIYGMPMNLEGYGFIYNKELFKEAGIDSLPSTLNELKAVSEKLQQAGITPFATGYYEEWKLGDHFMNIAFAQQEDPAAFIKGLNEGTDTISNNPKFKELLQLIDVTLEYGSDEPLSTDYSMEVNTFAAGEAAMILQGNWIQPMIDQRSPNMSIGILPIPINDDPDKEALVVNTPSYWVVNKQTTDEKKKEAKKFLNWMVSSEEGKRYMTERLKFIPAFKHIESDDSGPLAEQTMQYYEEGQTMSSNWFDFPVGVREEFGSATQLYIKNQITRDQLLQEYQKSWEEAQ